MPIGAETFVSAALQPLFERLFSLGEHLVMKLRNSGDLADKLNDWKEELDVIEALVDDAEHRQFQSKAVKKWVDDLQDLALDMEDVLEDVDIELQRLEFNANMDQQQDPVPVNMVTSLFNNLSTMFDRIDPDIQRKMEVIDGRLKAIYSRSQKLGLSAGTIMQLPTLHTEALRDKPESSSLGPEVFGRADSKEDIVTQLLEGHHGDKNYVLIPIVGMGGIGKTTLAQYAYNDEQVKGHFDLRAWVCVSDVFDVKRITTSIFKVVVGRETAVEFNSLDEAQTQLKQVLIMSKKLLIVLDDIWNEEYDAWDQLQEPLKHAAKGSRVIMTTRNKDIARMMNTDPSHNNIVNLEVLSDDDCWRVFQQHANNDFDLAELRNDVIKKCKGLPLAAKTLGGLLRKKVNIKQCRMVLENDPWSKENGAVPVLRLSYHYLPSHLKLIFAYCSVLRKDYEFTEKEIILLWMAQGFLLENQEGCMEDLGHDYFNDLRSRSLFEQSPDIGDWFVMHDLIHDLALWAAGGICYVMGTKDITQVDNWQRIRHVFFTEDGRTTLESQLPMASQLRTFYSDRYRLIENLNFSKDFCYLRTLLLSSSTMEVLPERIGGLKHLRFLRLSFDRIKELPISINKLWNLQTLWLEGCYKLEKVPHIGDLKHLRFFSLEVAKCIKELPKSISNLWNLQTLCLRDCSILKKVPNIRSLERLCHLEIAGTSLEEMPMGFEKVTNLQSLDEFILGHGCGARIRELKDLNQLEGELTICGLENVPTVEDAREAQLDKKCRLDKLALKWGRGRDEVDDNTRREVVEQLKPPSSIKECELKGYRGSAFPAWLGDPCFDNMVHISLINCTKCECLPPHIGDLKHLRFFSLEVAKCIKELPKSISNLWNLQTLCLRDCSILKKVPNIRSLERLCHLEIAGTSLEEMPMGFEKVTNLQSLDEFILGHGCGARIRELKDLNQLEGELRICGLENVLTVEDAREAQLDKKCRLDKLALDWGSGRDEVDDNTKREVVEQLKPPSSIKKCGLYGYRGSAFPTWLGDPCFDNMVDIRLINCEKCECLPPLGQLPQLEFLRILRMDGVEQIGSEFYGNSRCSNPFPTLKRLHFINMKSWERWLPADSDRAFPCLESLEIRGCGSLQGDVPLQYLPSLKTLSIENSKELSVSVPLQSLPSLEKLDVDRCNIQSITTSEGALKEEHGMSPSPKGSTPSPCELPHLTSLSISSCPTLISFPDGLLAPTLKKLEIIRCENMESLPREMHKYTSLQTLNLFYSPKIQCIPKGGLPKNLKTLAITQLSLKSIRCSILPYLTDLDIQGCPELESFEGNALPPQLHSLRIRNCPKLQFQFFVKQGCLPTNLKRLEIFQMQLNQAIQAWGLHRLHSLKKFTLKEVDTEEHLSLPSSLSEINIKGNQNVKNLSVVDGTTPLTKLYVKDCPKLESVVGNFTCLSQLSLESCPKLQPLPEIGLLLNLEFLQISEVGIDKPIREWGLHLLTSLWDLRLVDLGSCTDAVEHIPGPDYLQLPSSLCELEIGGFQKLKSIRCSTLPKLALLRIERCPQLESFADNALPPRLFEVRISECDLIKPRLVRDPHGRIFMDIARWSLC